MTGTRLESKRRSLQRGGLPAWAIPLATAIVGLILGLTWAWLIQPVEYTNADPGNLAPGAQEAWVEMVADSYAITTDSAEARRRLQFFEPDELQGMLAEEVSEAQRAGNLGAEQRLRGLADLLDTQPITGPEAVPAPADSSSPLGTMLMACGFGLLVVLLFFGVAVLVTRMRQAPAVATRRRPAEGARASKGAPGTLVDDELDEEARPVMLPYGVEGEAAIVEVDDELDMEDEEESIEDLFAGVDNEGYAREPEPSRRVGFAERDDEPVEYGPALAEFVTRYNYGDDGYDMSFPIETDTREFLGETGVGIGDTLNESSPQQVTAFEVWLFDKDDIRTVTKVLLSDHAWNDEELRSRLAPKGELIRIQEGDTVDLETKSLRVRARIREAEYSNNGTPQGYFERFVVELTAQRKE
jgi:hypothetical protein